MEGGRGGRKGIWRRREVQHLQKLFSSSLSLFSPLLLKNMLHYATQNILIKLAMVPLQVVQTEPTVGSPTLSLSSPQSHSSKTRMEKFHTGASKNSPRLRYCIIHIPYCFLYSANAHWVLEWGHVRPPSTYHAEKQLSCR